APHLRELDNPHVARTFSLALAGAGPRRGYRPGLAKVAHLIQMPAVDLARVVAREKGAPLTEADREELERRIADARRWLAAYAPEHYKFEVHSSLPKAVATLTRAQRQYLARVADALSARAWAGEE